MDGKTHSVVDERMRACIEECHGCHDICEEMVVHCLQMGGEYAEPSHIRLLLDCAEICQTSANFMLRMSDFHGQTCGVCADVCERCAKDCERFGDDPMMKQCAEVCRSCAQSCREMAEMTA
jgi:hypothetical protein